MARAKAPTPRADTPVRVYLGCGARRLPGFIHVDPAPGAHIDHVGPIDRLPMFADDSVDLIYASHVLERFGRYDIFDVVSEWYRVLRAGGILRLAGPDFAKAARHYLDHGDIREVIGLVVGRQDSTGDVHHSLFDETNLGELLLDVGFASVARYDWRRTEHAGHDDLSQSYLPHMDKDDGTLVSLNVEAVK